MKLKKKRYNLLKHKIITKKIFKLYTTESYFQVLKLQSIEFQVKQIVKVFFNFLLKNKRLKNFLFLNLSCFTGLNKTSLKKRLLNFRFLNFCLMNNFVNFQKLSDGFKTDLFTLNFFFYITFFKKYQRNLTKVHSELTTFLFTKNILNLKKLKHFYTYSYLIFWSEDVHFFLRIFKGLLRKVLQSRRVSKNKIKLQLSQKKVSDLLKDKKS